MEKYRLPAGVLIQEVASEMVLLDVDAGLYFELNTMGAEMLRCLQQSGDPRLVIETLLREYDVSRADLESDLRELLEQLKQQGLIQEVSDP